MGDYFIRIDDATDLRRKLLESSKATIHILRGHQHLAQVRSEKLTLQKSLRRELKEITMLMNRMDELIPQLTKSEVQELNPSSDLPALERSKRPATRSKKKAPTKTVSAKEKQVYLGRPQEKKHEHKVRPSAPPVKIVERPKDRTELEKLHDKLSDIESKLGNL